MKKTYLIIMILFALILVSRTRADDDSSEESTEDEVSQDMNYEPAVFSELSMQPSWSDNRALFYNQITGTNRNLFGGGEMLSANVLVNQSGSGGNLTDLEAEVRYVQPSLFGNADYFATVGIVGSTESSVASAGTNQSNYLAAYAHVGMKLFTASQLTIGYEQMVSGGFSGPSFASLGVSPYGDKPGTGFVILGFGWNTLDSATFPREGSILNFYLGVNPFIEGSLVGGLQYRKYFSLGGDSILILNFGGPANFAGNPVFASQAAEGIFSYPLSIGFAQDVSRGIRLSTEAGLYTLGIGTVRDIAGGPGINLGVSLEVPEFGIINIRVGYEVTGVTS
jgi:hypothetical protein